GLRDQLRRVAAIMLLQELENAARVPERLIFLRRLAVAEAAAVAAVAGLFTAGRRALLALARCPVHLHPRVPPARRIVSAFLRVPAGEEAVEVLRVGELLV